MWLICSCIDMRSCMTQVYIHLSVARESGEVLQTTRPEQEGSGIPVPFVLGKGRRAPRGWELAVAGQLFSLHMISVLGVGIGAAADQTRAGGM